MGQQVENVNELDEFFGADEVSLGQLPTTTEEVTPEKMAEAAPEGEQPVGGEELSKEEENETLETEKPVEPAKKLEGAEEKDPSEELRSELADALGKLAQAEVMKLDTPAEPEMKLPEDPKEITQIDFLGDIETAHLLEDPNALNYLLNKVATVAAQAGKQAGYEMAMRSIPGITTKALTQQLEAQRVATEFYTANPDLTPFKQAVGLACLEFAKKNPNATQSEILKGAGDMTREILRIRGTQRARVPAQPASTVGSVERTTKPAKPVNSIEEQISALIDID